MEVLEHSRTVPLLPSWPEYTWGPRNWGPEDVDVRMGGGQRKQDFCCKEDSTPNLALSSLYKSVVPKATLFFFL